jgi:hypothetical protein
VSADGSVNTRTERFELRQLAAKGLPSLLISRHRALETALRALTKEHDGDQLDMYIVDRLAPRPDSVPAQDFRGVVIVVGRDKLCKACFEKASHCACRVGERCCKHCTHEVSQ